MEIKNIEVYANKINLGCCEHKRRQYKYFFGYVGFKCCKVVMCLDCEKVQFVGNFFGKLIYLSTRKFCRNRFEVLNTITIDITDEDGFGLDGTCVVCGTKIPFESGKQYCISCGNKYFNIGEKDYGNETKSEN